MPSRQRPWIIVDIFVSSVIASDKLNCLVLPANRSLASEESPSENVLPDVSSTEKIIQVDVYVFFLICWHAEKKRANSCSSRCNDLPRVIVRNNLSTFKHKSWKVLVCFDFSQDFIVQRLEAGVLLPVERKKNCQRCKRRRTKKTDDCVSSRQCFESFFVYSKIYRFVVFCLKIQEGLGFGKAR